jgi:hypothetical protein
MILMGENPLLGPLVGVGPENLDLFWPQMTLTLLVAISGSKKSQFSGPTPLPMTLVMD